MGRIVETTEVIETVSGSQIIQTVYSSSTEEHVGGGIGIMNYVIGYNNPTASITIQKFMMEVHSH